VAVAGRTLEGAPHKYDSNMCTHPHARWSGVPVLSLVRAHSTITPHISWRNSLGKRPKVPSHTGLSMSPYSNATQTSSPFSGSARLSGDTTGSAQTPRLLPISAGRGW
jgi:hypothetical protein